MALPKYIIWTPGRGRTLIAPGQTMLRLTHDEGGPRPRDYVYLIACNPDGSPLHAGCLLTLDRAGTLQLSGSINSAANLALGTDNALYGHNYEGDYLSGTRIFTPTLPT